MAAGPQSRPLDELREEARALFNGVEDYAIFTLDTEGHVLSWNAGARKIKGYEEQEIVGDSFTRFYTAEDRAAGKPHRLLCEAADHGRVEDEGWRVRKDGSRFWADVVLTALRDDAGELRGFLKVTRDVTLRRESEESLRLREQRVRMLLEGIRDYAIFMLDRDGHIISWNQGAERTQGYRAEEALGRHISLFFTAEDLCAGRPQRLLREAAEHGRVEDEGWRVRKDGTRFWADAIITRLEDEAGQLRGFAKITRDLTDRRRAEEATRLRARQQAAIAELGLVALKSRDLQALLDHAASTVQKTLEVDFVRVLEVLPEGDRLLLRAGVGWKDGLVGLATMPGGPGSQDGYILHNGDSVIVANLDTDERFQPSPLLSEHRVRSGVNVTIAAPGEGQPRYGLVGAHSRRLRAFSPDDAHFLQAVANVISTALARRQMEGQLRLAEHQAEIERLRTSRAREQVRERDDFLSVAAHELRTPLTALQLKLQSIESAWRKRPGEATAARFEARIEGALRQTERLTELIERLLDVSRIAQGRLVLTLEKFDLRELLCEVVDDFGEQATHARSEISLIGGSVVGTWDRGRLAQAVINVLANAIKYGGGKPIDVRLDRNGAIVRIAVQDRGIGISAEDIERIFGRFERAAPLRHYGGMGLGLYITRHIVHAHGGSITVRSQVGEGATFIVELPLQTVSAEAGEGAEATE
jgi:PAS domain S-box-containing protein